MLQSSSAQSAPSLAGLKIKIFGDGADKAGIIELAKNPYVRGFTTNPTLMRKAGISDYEAFARDLLTHIPQYPISFEVFADDNAEMLRQAKKIATWGESVYVKIPVTNTRRETTAPIVRELTPGGVKLNIILPRDNDEDQVEPANRSSIQQLWAASRYAPDLLHIYRYHGTPGADRMNHTKAMSVDGKWALVGSANLDQRSLHGTAPGFLFNRELSLSIADPKFVGKLDDMFKADMAVADPVTDDWVKGLAKEQKAIDRAEAMDILF